MPPKQRSVAGPSRGGQRYTHGLSRGHTTATTTQRVNTTRDVYDPTAWTTTMDGTDEIDPDGDLTLVVGSGEHRFRVSRVAMRLASPVWKNMLTGDFSEAASDEVKLPADDAFAVRILLLLAHLQYRRVPECITLELLGSIAQVVDKYEMGEMANDRIAAWVNEIDPEIKNGDYMLGPSKDPAVIIADGCSFMWIGWAIRNQFMFCEGMEHVMWFVSPKDLAKEADLPPGCRGKAFLSAVWTSLTWSEFLHKWCQTRLQELMDAAYKLLEDEQDGKKCALDDNVSRANADRCALMRRGIALDLLLRLSLPITTDNKPDVMTFQNSARACKKIFWAVMRVVNPSIDRDEHCDCLNGLMNLSALLDDVHRKQHGEIEAEFSSFFEEENSKKLSKSGTRESPLKVD